MPPYRLVYNLRYKNGSLGFNERMNPCVPGTQGRRWNFYQHLEAPRPSLPCSSLLSHLLSPWWPSHPPGGLCPEPLGSAASTSITCIRFADCTFSLLRELCTARGPRLSRRRYVRAQGLAWGRGSNYYSPSSCCLPSNEPGALSTSLPPVAYLA